ncbi:serine hydrolase [Xylophilus sp. GOD-11R]|uniref:serine hydrolase n=1 Tax=Xylophilus sp. GOD-11R TaxID=3089814 RepID=UPI00298CBA93|nr:serine hydrolase [Xylophilus sp. GOD-11R]WPB57965.1 serine hydrolase [Xylophilus sp. GOD-11R]
MSRLIPRLLSFLLLACALAGTARAQQPAWADRFTAGLAEIDGREGPEIGVYVRDLGTGESAGFRTDENWYFASTVKVPIAIAVLRAVERGRLTLDTPVLLRATDYVDGAGSTNRRPPGAHIAVRKLLEQMIIYSDNTASDLLIGLVGIDEVNAVVRSLVPRGFGRITRLADVRRAIYGGLDPAAERLAGRDLLALHAQPTDAARLTLFSQLVDVPAAAFRQPSLDAAFDRYYASGLNAGQLPAYGDLLAALAEGRALGPAQTRYLLGLMQKLATGRHRVGAGLPPSVVFAHKTGTQRRRICDSGIVTVERDGAPPQRLVLVACARQEPSLPRAERALQQVGTALCRSGLITKGVPDAPTCDATAGPSRRSAASQRSGR